MKQRCLTGRVSWYLRLHVFTNKIFMLNVGRLRLNLFVYECMFGISKYLVKNRDYSTLECLDE